MRNIKLAIFMSAVTAVSFGQDSNTFKLMSSTFANGAIMPISTVHNNLVNGVNTCSIDGSPGGNQSPELYWSGAPAGTKTFAVVTFDTTASFTHWGIYNIPGTATGLPENAGVPGSKYGKQVYNDFYIAPEYDGPCPPTNVEPDTHHYVFTVYALDESLDLPGSKNFPPNAETLYQALIKAGYGAHILGTASLIGLYSSTPK